MGRPVTLSDGITIVFFAEIGRAIGTVPATLSSCLDNIGHGLDLIGHDKEAIRAELTALIARYGRTKTLRDVLIDHLPGPKPLTQTGRQHAH